jgi:hypothetical protein
VPHVIFGEFARKMVFGGSAREGVIMQVVVRKAQKLLKNCYLVLNETKANP